MNTRIARTLAGLLAGLGLALAVQAEPVDGEVKKIDTEDNKVTIRHGGIKSLDMPAIQMAFRVQDPAMLKSLQVGDKVRFSADKINGHFTVTSIEVRK
ncbi:MAG: copper-binding protein [Aquabacterium sp.]